MSDGSGENSAVLVQNQPKQAAPPAAVCMCLAALRGACGSVAGTLRSDLLMVPEMRLLEEILVPQFPVSKARLALSAVAF